MLKELGPEAYAERWPSTGARCARRSTVTAGSRWTHRETRSSWPSLRPSEAVSAAQEAQDALAGGPIRVRMGLHTGDAASSPARGTSAMDVHLGARIAAAGHGGQVLLSQATAALVDGEDRSTSASTC